MKRVAGCGFGTGAKDVQKKDGGGSMDEINTIIKGWLRMDGDILIYRPIISVICYDLLTESQSPVRSLYARF